MLGQGRNKLPDGWRKGRNTEDSKKNGNTGDLAILGGTGFGRFRRLQTNENK